VSTSEPANQARQLISNEAFERLRSARHRDPSAIASVLNARIRRPLIQGDGRLLIVAADHPARGALGARKKPMAMASRYDLLQRVVLALSRPGVDGVLGTPDIIEDLALLGALDDKVTVGSMNRGGLRGAIFEMDDRYTGYDVESMLASGLDAAKLLVRVNLRDAATVRTLESTARAVTACAQAKLPIMLEPFMSEWADGQVVNDLSTEAVITSVAIATAIGASAAYTWLKLPVVKDMQRVMEATTVPTMLLGGDADANPKETYAAWSDALALPGVHGLIVGRTLLYPQDDDVARAVDIAAALVHGRSNTLLIRPPRPPSSAVSRGSISRRLHLWQEGRMQIGEHQSFKTRFNAAYDIEVQAWVDAACRGEIAGPSAWDGYKVAVACAAGLRALEASGPVEPKLPETPAFYAAGA
jgi:DhnA family fructose-bisphosphate aldolase class Ia